VNRPGEGKKTVTGFMYRHSKSEVSIVCVCHGNRFSPTKFLQFEPDGGILGSENALKGHVCNFLTKQMGEWMEGIIYHTLASLGRSSNNFDTFGGTSPNLK